MPLFRLIEYEIDFQSQISLTVGFFSLDKVEDVNLSCSVGCRRTVLCADRPQVRRTVDRAA